MDPDERREPLGLTWTGKRSGKQSVYARALFLSDRGQNGPAWTVARTAEAPSVSEGTIEHLKQRFVEEGPETPLRREPCERRTLPKFNGAFELRRVA